MIYTSTLAAIVSALAAEAIDNTSKQAWQKLYRPGYQDGFDLATLKSSKGSSLSRLDVDCWVYARLHSQLKERHWNVLLAKYTTHNVKRKAAIEALIPLIATPAPRQFLGMAVYTWAIPKMKGLQGKRSSDVLMLEDWFYDMSNWDTDARPEPTKRRWRGGIRNVLDEMVEEAVSASEALLEAEGVLLNIAA